MDDAVSYTNIIISMLFAVGVFFTVGRIAPNLIAAVFLYSIPNILFIYDVQNIYITIFSVNAYLGFDLALLLTSFCLIEGHRNIKEGCRLQENSLWGEASCRYTSFHQHCIDVFNF